MVELPPHIQQATGRHYEVSQLLGSGGFAQVFKAVQKTTGQDVAIKLLKLKHGADSAPMRDRIERFELETRICAELHHPNIVPLIDSGRIGPEQVYVVFALVPGWTLGDVLAAEGPLDPHEAIHLMSQVIDALSCAHAKGVVHRDLKPQNIMVNTAGARRNAMVLDFGLSALITEGSSRSARGEYVGTPAYSAPEQLRGELPTVRSDLYAWGLIFIECLTGLPVLGGLSPNEMVHRHLSPEPVPIPSWLEMHGLGELLRGVTQKDVARRVVTAAEIIRALEHIARTSLPRRSAVADMPVWGSQPSRASMLVPSRPVSRSNPVWLVPLQRNQDFTGRKAILDRVSKCLGEASGLSVVALHGMGGVGKTQLALEYTYQHSGQYSVLAWLRAEDPESLARDYSAIASALGLPETRSRRRTVEAVRGYLERSDDWLLVFDNAPNPSAIRAYLPRSRSGHTIVTSRHPSWRELATSIEVDVLGTDEAVEFLVNRTGQAGGEGATQLCSELGRLPLALEEASAYMEATGRSIEGYLPLLRSQQRRILLETTAPGRPSALRTTWEISFRELEVEDPAALDLLKLCAFFAPDDIPLALLRRTADALPGDFGGLGDLVVDEISLDACLATLRRYSLVKAEGDSLTIHRLVQLTTRERLSAVERQRWATAALHLVEAAYPKNAAAGEYHPESGRLMAHAKVALAHTEPHTQCPHLAGRLLRRTGVYLSAKGLHDSASEHLDAALTLLEQAPSPDHDQVGGALWDHGMVLYALGEVRAAEDALRRGLATIERHRGPDHLVSAQILIALCWVQRTAGDFAGTLTNAERALAIVEGISGPSHPLTATCHALIARALYCLNRIGEARLSVKKALKALEAKRSPLHPLNCGTWYMLAQIMLDLGDLDGCLLAAGHAIEVGERAYGHDHQLVCASRCARGTALQRRGDCEAAQQSLERGLRNAEHTCRYLHEDLAVARSELALLKHAEDAEAARAQLQHFLRHEDRLCGHLGRVVGHARISLAILLRQGGATTEARRRCQQGLKVIASDYGEDHPLQIWGLNALGWILRDEGARTAAREQFVRATEIAEAAGLTDHHEYAESIEGLATLLSDEGDEAGARERFTHVLDLYTKRLGENHPATQRVTARLG